MTRLDNNLIIIGAGPAGLMTAIMSARRGLRALVLDGQKNIGKKLLMSGGGRCNVTNLKVEAKDYITTEERTVRNVLAAFPVSKVIEFFKEQNVLLTLEEMTKYFPEEQSARVVLDALLKCCSGLNVEILKEHKVKNISKKDGAYEVSGDNFNIDAKSVVIATGGLSYPATGSDGFGYELAKKIGHRITKTHPSLVPFLTNDADWKSIAGITLDVELTLLVDEKKVRQSNGAFLWTHFGFSGPAVMDLSGAWNKASGHDKKILARFILSKTESEFLNEVKKTIESNGDRSFKRVLSVYLPERLIEILLKQNQISVQIKANQIPKNKRDYFLKLLFHYPLPVSKTLGYDKAEVTTGGIDMSEVDAKTLESKLSKGIYFAGEVLDVDGRLGGFNFQWAWASGAAVANAIAKYAELSR